MWFRSHQALSVRPLVRHSWISSIHSWSERLGCLWTILVQLLCCVLWVYWTSNTSLWTKLVQCLNSLGLEWLSHELAGMERRWVIQRLPNISLQLSTTIHLSLIQTVLFSTPRTLSTKRMEMLWSQLQMIQHLLRMVSLSMRSAVPTQLIRTLQELISTSSLTLQTNINVSCKN